MSAKRGEVFNRGILESCIYSSEKEVPFSGDRYREIWPGIHLAFEQVPPDDDETATEATIQNLKRLESKKIPVNCRLRLCRSNGFNCDECGRIQIKTREQREQEERIEPLEI